jgi:hypothetical protein
MERLSSLLVSLYWIRSKRTCSKESCSIATVIGFKNGMQHSKLETVPSRESILEPFRVSKEVAAA